MDIVIKQDKCVGCGLCVSSCPLKAIIIENRKVKRDQDKCNFYGACVEACRRFKAIELVRNEVEQVQHKNQGIWIVAEHHEDRIAEVTLELLNEGAKLVRDLNQPLSVVLLGNGLSVTAQDLIFYGADIVYLVESPQLCYLLEDPYTDVIVDLIRKYQPNIVLISATTFGRSLAPRVASRLATGLTADCTGLVIDKESGNLLQTRPAFGGNLMATISCPNHRPQMATVRPKVFQKAEPNLSRTGEIIRYDISQVELTQRTEVLEVIKEITQTNNLSEADIIVAGGRGMGDQKNFALLIELAEVLGGAVGASRAVVDAGWVPYAQQIGQTGRTVCPKLYIACGIHGAIQHLVGMQSSKVIVAINKNPEAPIFKVATYGIVGDVLEVFPLLIKAVKKGR